MIRQAYHLEIIIIGKGLDAGKVDLLIKRWQRNLRAQAFEHDGMRLKIRKIRKTEVPGEPETLDKSESIFRQVGDPLVETQKIRK